MQMGDAALLCLLIAGLPVVLDMACCQEHLVTRLRERYAAFLAPLQGGAAVIRLQQEEGPPFVPWQPGPWQIRTARHGRRVVFESHLEKGWVDLATGHGCLTLRGGGDPENFLRVLYAWLCLDAGALLLHAAGVIRHGRGYVFCGPSGSGKTTVARLSPPHTVLSDDLVILKKDGRSLWVCGVPFRGDLPEAPRANAAAELAGVFLLAKADKHYLVPAPAPEAVARLAACVPFLMGQPAAAARVMDLCADLVAAVPVRWLHFRRDAGLWEVIDESACLSSASSPSGHAHYRR